MKSVMMTFGDCCILLVRNDGEVLAGVVLGETVGFASGGAA